MTKKKVYQHDLNSNYIQFFNSRQEAANAVGVSEFAIRSWIKNRTKCKEWIWSDKMLGTSVEELFQELETITDTKLLKARESLLEAKKNFDEELDRAAPKEIIIHKSSYQETMPKILLIDVETAPLKAFTWGMWQQDVSLKQLISDFFIISWSAKYLNETTLLSERVTGEEAKQENDKRIIKKLWTILDESDIVIAHNGDKFDIPKINARFVVHGLNPPSSYKQIDTLKIAKSNFGFSSNKLQHLATSFGIEGKYDTDFDLWKRCLEGDEASLEYMEKYNRQDVLVLEKVYLKLLPFSKGHPNLNLYSDESFSCPHCGSTKLTPEVDKYFYTQAVKYQLYRCQECSSLSRAKQSSKFMNKKTISPIPR